jgi:hypothetical protein
VIGWIEKVRYLLETVMCLQKAADYLEGVMSLAEKFGVDKELFLKLDQLHS